MSDLYLKHPEAEDIEIDGRWIVWQCRQRVIVKLDGLPGGVWRHVRRKKDHQKMVRQISIDHRLPADRAEKVIASVLRELQQIGLLRKLKPQEDSPRYSRNDPHE